MAEKEKKTKGKPRGAESAGKKRARRSPHEGGKPKAEKRAGPSGSEPKCKPESPPPKPGDDSKGKPPPADLLQWLYRFKVPCSRWNLEAIAYFEGRGIPLQLNDKPVNDHEISHILRTYALLVALRSAVGPGVMRITALDVFGSKRTLKIDPKILPLGSAGLSIDWTIGEFYQVRGDAGRIAARDPILDGQVFDFVCMTDVYHGGPDPYAGWAPGSLVQLAEYSAGHCLFMISRIFVGNAGAEVYGNRVEGVWYLDEDMVVFSPEPGHAPYPAHPNVRLLDQRVIGDVSIYPIENMGPFHLLRIERQARGATVLPVLPLLGQIQDCSVPSSLLTRVVAPLRHFYERCRGSRVPSKQWKCTKVVDDLKYKFAVRELNSSTIDVAVSSVPEALLKIPEIRAIRDRFPHVYSWIQKGTLSSVLYQDKNEIVNELWHLRGDNQFTENRVAKLRALEFKPDSTWYSVLVAVFLALLVYTCYTGFVMRPASVFPEHPDVLMAALFEESATLLFPRGVWILFIYEFYQLVQVSYHAAIVVLFVHIILWNLHRQGYRGSIAAFSLHFMFNALVMGKINSQLIYSIIPTVIVGMMLLRWGQFFKPKEKRFQLFTQTYEEGSTVEPKLGHWEVIPAHSTLPSYQTLIDLPPQDFRGTVDISVDGVECSAAEAFGMLNNQGEKVLYCILVTCGTLWMPSKDEKSLLAALLHRVHNDPFVECAPPSERHNNWKELIDIAMEMGLFDVLEHGAVPLAECVARMRARGKRILHAAEVDRAGQNMKLWKRITLKWNETLPMKMMMTSTGMESTLKPRAITNLDPIYHARGLPWARAISEYMHTIFDGRLFEVRDGAGVLRPVRIHYASGYTQGRLDYLALQMQTNDIVFASAGDDSVIAWGWLSLQNGRFGESDFSAFDHTQDDGPQKIAASVWMRALGIPDDIIDMFYQCCSKPYTVRSGRLRVKGNAGTQMPTGTSVTTAQSSLNTILFYLWTIYRMCMFPNYTVPECARELGFKVKYVERRDFGQVTFLKGWWRQDTFGGHTWMPFPSACLKIGKTLRSPFVIFRSTNPGQRNKTFALRKMAYAIAASFGHVDREYPILGEFIHTLRRLGQETVLDEDREKYIENASHKVRLEVRFINRNEALVAIEGRYGLSGADVSRVERLLQEVTELPAYLEDPAFIILRDIDYC